MGNTYFQYYKSKLLMMLIIYIVTIIIWMKINWSFAISATTVLGILFWMIDKYLWKYKPFKWLFSVPNFSGRYEGKFCYYYIDKSGIAITGELKHVKIISQTGSLITIHSFTVKEDGARSSMSKNCGLFIQKTSDGKHFEMVFNYLNDGDSRRSLHPHHGTDVLKFIEKPEGKVLTGSYYTDRSPQTKGEYIQLKWVSNDLNHEF